MNTIQEFAEKLGLNCSYLANLINNCDKFYYSYYVSKKSGGKRMIDAPNYEIKAIQGWILRNILDKISVTDRANGFIKGRGIKRNAQFHLNNIFIMNLDIEDFFPSIKFIHVYEFFKKSYNTPMAINLTKLCTFNNYLPQGGVTSPSLSNIIFKDVDDKIINLCDAEDVNYSRYADDLTFSCNYFNKLKDLLNSIEAIIKTFGFKLNEKKTRFYTKKNKLIVTGILLNSGRLTIGRQRKKKIRSMVFNHFIKKDQSINLSSMVGNIAFARDIEPGYAEKINTYRDKIIKKFQPK